MPENLQLWAALGGFAVVGLWIWLISLPDSSPPPMPAEEQQRLGDMEWAAYLVSAQGKTLIFGEYRAAARRIQDRYPLWRLVPGGGPIAEGPRHAEYL